MGRHRSDPRGLARILLIALAVAAALSLLVVGGMALVNAVSSGDEQQGPALSASPSAGEGSASPTAASSSQTVPLEIRVTGSPTEVFVRVSDTGEVLTQGTLAAGEVRRYDEAPLAVVAADGSALEVVVYGEAQETKPAGQRAEWSVPER